MTSVVYLIKVSGPDKPGITHAISTLLAKDNINVLDIGQAVIHDNLVLGLLIEVTHEISRDDLFQSLQKNLKVQEMIIELNPVNTADYAVWMQAQGKPRHILTLLARKIESRHLSCVTSMIADYNLNIDKITRLSGRVPLEEPNEKSIACVEFSLRGALNNEQKVRSALLELASGLDVDIAVQEDDMFRRNRRLVAFDMDSTLIEAEVIDELAKVAGVGNEVAAITESAMRGEINFNESFKQRVALLKGLDVSALEQVAGNLRLTEGAETLLKTLNKLGYKTAILSGGFTYFANKLRDKLGFDYVYANDLDIVDGKVTGEVTGNIIDGHRKASLLQEIVKQESLTLEQTIAIGDGANDLPMLSIAGLGIAFRAKPLVERSARQSISNLGLDSILYLLGITDRERMHVEL